MNDDRDYAEEVKINAADLESEWLEQGSYYLHYGEGHANAIFDKDISKSELDYVHSVLYDEVKTDWKKHFDTKPTEVAIKEWITRNPRHRKAELAFIKATRDANVLLNVKNSFEHRKKALENLVSLKITGMYSEPTNKVRQIAKRGDAGAAQRKELNLDRDVKKVDTGIRAGSRKRKRLKRNIKS